ncbi:3-hydroxyacyl-ACP dehydratase FabZ [bacterium]|nr:3-hydroxyacyl-ACP dehydratase FabZ [bacterium]
MLDIKEIMKRTPHRSPIFFVDRVETLEFPRISGYKNVTVNEPYFRGHFPGSPIMPGVLQVEALAQLCWLLYAGNPDAPVKAERLELTRLPRIKFRQPVVPGDKLCLEAEETERSGNSCTLKVQATVEGKTTCEGVMVFELK